MKYRMYRLIALMLTVSMMSGLVACGKAENAVALGTEVDYLDDITTAPDSTESESTEVKDSEDVIEFPTDDTEVENSETTESTESTENTESSESTEKEPTNTENDGSNGNDSGNNGNGDNGDVVVDNTPTNSETSEPVTTPEVDTPSTPSTSGGHVSFIGSTNLPSLGISIPTIGGFNKEALNNNVSWAGDDSTTEGHNAMQTFIDTAASIESAVRNKGVPCDSGFLLGNGAIEWEFSTYGSMNALELWKEPSNNRYRLEVNMRLADGHHVLAGTDLAPYARDVLKYMCSVVSSTPDTLYANIYQDIEGEVCISDSSWTTVGDCKVKFDLNNSYNNHYVYYIKQN